MATSRDNVETKTTMTDLVTETDRASERLIVETLLRARPHDGVLGEEGANTQGSSGVRWVIDPIDGTTDFFYGYPGFNVSIAAEVDGTVIAGAVADVYLGELYSAGLGAGASVEGRAIRCNTSTPLNTALVATGFGYHPTRRKHQARVVYDIIDRIRDIRRGGAAATDLCSVARGRVDAYFEMGLAPWDFAAGALIVAEAGGRVGTLDGSPLGPRFVMAAGVDLFGPLADLLRSVDADCDPLGGTPAP